MAAKTKTASGGRSAKRLAITLVHGLMGWPERQRRTVRSLGLKRRSQTVIHDDTPAIRGKVAAVCHLVCMKEL